MWPIGSNRCSQQMECDYKPPCNGIHTTPKAKSLQPLRGNLIIVYFLLRRRIEGEGEGERQPLQTYKAHGYCQLA